jgi:hypothetical protein
VTDFRSAIKVLRDWLNRVDKAISDFETLVEADMDDKAKAGKSEKAEDDRLDAKYPAPGRKSD